MENQTFTENASLLWRPIPYTSLNASQQRTCNFQKVSGILADYGYLNDNLSGRYFNARHIDGTVLKVRLIGRLTIDRNYQDQDIHICFPWQGQWYLYPHDLVLNQILATTGVSATRSWDKGLYNFPSLSKEMQSLLEPYRLNTNESQ